MCSASPKPYRMEFWTDEEFRSFEPIGDALEKYGYFVSSSPIEGQFEQWLVGIKKSLKCVELNANLIRSEFGYRGISKNLIAALHATLPDPSWSVQIQPSRRVV